MNCRRCREMAGVLGLVLLMAVPTTRANNIQVTNVTVTARDNNTALVQFDISWENSWRHLVNHDAAWVFFKALPTGGNWQQVILEGTGTNPPSYSTGDGTAVQMIVPDDGMGLFMRRAGQGSGTVSVTNVQVVWNIAASGLTPDSELRMQVFAIEMVYVAGGSFYAGDGLSDVSQLFAGGGGTVPYQVTNETAITCANSANNLWAASRMTSGTIPDAYPKGYAAFYCMKYEVSEGQWVDFFNTLEDGQKSERDITASLYAGKNSDGVMNRNTVSWTNALSPATTLAPDRACHYMGWGDTCAFAAWSGLRPMTELEYEKACRGPLDAVAGEYAWGTAMLTNLTGVTGTDGSGTETPSPATANCLVSGGLAGPARVGIFATSTSGRQSAGASYWGIMELSGSLWERAITAGYSNGRSFTGTHGTGVLDASGNATNADWSVATTDHSVIVFRGGSRAYGSTYARVSNRGILPNDTEYRYGWNGYYVGCRSVRSAPDGVEP